MNLKKTAGGFLAAVAIIAGALGTPAASASINNGNVYTSNGEAGWFTFTGGRVDEVHTQITTDPAAEQSPALKGTTLGNGIELCDGTWALQAGEVWNPAEKAFDVVWAEGPLTRQTPSTNTNNCTGGGPVAVTFTQTTNGTTVGCAFPEHCGSVSVQDNGIPVGHPVYLQVRQWNTHIQVLAEDLGTGLGNTSDAPFTNIPALASYAHWAAAGTIFDQTNRSAPAVVPEAFFCWLRASTASSSHGATVSSNKIAGQYFSDAGSAETVQSTANGTSVDPALVAPTPIDSREPGGMGCFTINTGSPTGA